MIANNISPRFWIIVLNIHLMKLLSCNSDFEDVPLPTCYRQWLMFSILGRWKHQCSKTLKSYLIISFPNKLKITLRKYQMFKYHPRTHRHHMHNMLHGKGELNAKRFKADEEEKNSPFSGKYSYFLLLTQL